MILVWLLAAFDANAFGSDNDLISALMTSNPSKKQFGMIMEYTEKTRNADFAQRIFGQYAFTGLRPIRYFSQKDVAICLKALSFPLQPNTHLYNEWIQVPTIGLLDSAASAQLQFYPLSHSRLHGLYDIFASVNPFQRDMDLLVDAASYLNDNLFNGAIKLIFESSQRFNKIQSALYMQYVFGNVLQFEICSFCTQWQHLRNKSPEMTRIMFINEQPDMEWANYWFSPLEKASKWLFIKDAVYRANNLALIEAYGSFISEIIYSSQAFSQDDRITIVHITALLIRGVTTPSSTFVKQRQSREHVQKAMKEVWGMDPSSAQTLFIEQVDSFIKIHDTAKSSS